MGRKTVPTKPLVFSSEVRLENLKKLKSLQFDILVIGGGITGAGIVRDAAMRGYRTALIEKDDFASGTSSKSSKLIHGGFRYLKNLEFGLVHEALLERKTLMDIAPHLVHPAQCILPIYETNSDPGWMIHLGLLMYDLLSFRKNIGHHRMISGEDIENVVPLLRKEGLKQIAQYYDCLADDFRLVMANILSASQHSACIASYVKATGILKKESRVAGVQAEDQLTGQTFPIQSRVIANASGPWSDEVREILFRETDKCIRTTKGVHLVFRNEHLPFKYPIVFPSIQDQRPIYAIPWRKFVFLGTTDTDYHGNPDRILTERTDVDYLLASFNYYFPAANLNDEHIVSTFAGLRPLIYESGKLASAITREHKIFESPKNFFTIIGGKLTTYRTMAMEIVNRMAKRLDNSFKVSAVNSHCKTDKEPLYGGDIPDYPRFFRKWEKVLMEDHAFDAEIAQHFIETYGSRIPDLLAIVLKAPDGKERMLPDLPYVWGELYYALDYEMALALDDFLIRRTHLFSLDADQARDIHETVADRLGESLKWGKTERQAQIDRYKMKIDTTRYFMSQSRQI